MKHYILIVCIQYISSIYYHVSIRQRFKNDKMKLYTFMTMNRTLSTQKILHKKLICMYMRVISTNIVACFSVIVKELTILTDRKILSLDV